MPKGSRQRRHGPTTSSSHPPKHSKLPPTSTSSKSSTKTKTKTKTTTTTTASASAPSSSVSPLCSSYTFPFPYPSKVDLVSFSAALHLDPILDADHLWLPHAALTEQPLPPFWQLVRDPSGRYFYVFDENGKKRKEEEEEGKGKNDNGDAQRKG